ncbi:FAD-dependent oxidoreductase [Pedobacter sp. SYSU D00535]|uniref:FAD-dependent oxidoreductase n=1 Tax=Pedobacter sp. SYSU D00535 TaxID=2810308 RepID=UPI001A95B0C7|nr:FAD-dependent oxidoreductase [Pedobacter sp. SYSU D00535]
MKRYILGILSLLLVGSAFAQRNKTGVVVFGATPSGLAAAIQSAHSGAKTTLVHQGEFTSITINEAERTFKTGVYGDFLKLVDSLKSKSQSQSSGLTPEFVGTVFKGWTDTIKNLTVVRKGDLKEVKRDGKFWEAEFKDKSEIKATVFIDATTNSVIASLAKVAMPSPLLTVVDVYSDKKYRTSVAPVSGQLHFLPISALIAGKENFLVTGASVATSTFAAGQAAGAVGAYCAFFNKETKELDIRIIQAELLAYRSQLFNFTDISPADSSFSAIQKLAATGILKGRLVNNNFLFMPDSTVLASDIRDAMKEYYSRSQIWFLDNKAERLSLKEVLSLIKFTANRGDELDREVERAWNKSLKLSGKFDLSRIVTRRELAVLFEAYMKPFARSVNNTGNLVV